jgi:hypothetical protein
MPATTASIKFTATVARIAVLSGVCGPRPPSCRTRSRHLGSWKLDARSNRASSSRTSNLVHTRAPDCILVAVKYRKLDIHGSTATLGNVDTTRFPGVVSCASIELWWFSARSFAPNPNFHPTRTRLRRAASASPTSSFDCKK